MAVKRKAKKTTTKTATKKKKAPASRPRRVDHIDYRCILSRCTPLPRHARIGIVGGRVTLEAQRTNATIKFRRDSPFAGSKTISLRDGDPVTKTIVNSGTFEYDLTCSACTRRLAGPPSMIVD
jgi:hypothetical protein